MKAGNGGGESVNEAAHVLYVEWGALGYSMLRTLENERIRPVSAESGVEA